MPNRIIAQPITAIERSASIEAGDLEEEARHHHRHGRNREQEHQPRLGAREAAAHDVADADDEARDLPEEEHHRSERADMHGDVEREALIGRPPAPAAAG
jgi:hypothetical protein